MSNRLRHIQIMQVPELNTEYELNSNMLTEFNNQPDENIIDKLENDEYDMVHRSNEELMYCMMLINMQLMIFEKMFDGEDLSEHIGYIDGKEFKFNEQDLLISGNIAKRLKPIMDTICAELERRSLIYEGSDFKTLLQTLYQDSITFYIFKHNIQK